MTRDADENGWVSSAAPWVARMQDGGDFSRKHVLDAPMMSVVRASGAKTALDVGCGEGRFCRLMHAEGLVCTGLDPVPEMIEAARNQHPDGTYLTGYAETMPFDDEAFDLVVSYLTLIDIDDAATAICEMARVLRPGGHLLIANLSSFSTSAAMEDKVTCADTGVQKRVLGDYLTARKAWFEWDGLRIQNWHRPLSDYMQACLASGLVLTEFQEPVPHSGPAERREAYARMPYLMLMVWRKPDDQTSGI